MILFTALCNLALLVFAASLWVSESSMSGEEFLIFSGLTLLPLINVFTLWTIRSQAPPSLIGTYIKRKRLEEERKIKDLEKNVGAE